MKKSKSWVNKNNFGKSKYAKMNWKQVKARFPGLSPTGDVDFDGTINKKDCRPLDPAKDGVFGRLLGIVTGGAMGQTKEEYRAERKAKKTARKVEAVEKARKSLPSHYKYLSPKMQRKARLKAIRREEIKRKAEKVARVVKVGAIPSTRIMRAVEKAKYPIKRRKAETGTGQVGRPAGVYKHRDPRTGKPIPAPQFYRIRRALKRQRKQMAEMAKSRERTILARQGMPPQLARALQARREMELQQQLVQQPQQVQQVPVQPQQFPTQPRFRVVTDLMTGRKFLQPLPQREAWVR